jgi:hypothetical protein
VFSVMTKYSDHIEKCYSGKQCTISFQSHEEDYFELPSSEETVVLTFKTSIIYGKLTC